MSKRHKFPVTPAKTASLYARMEVLGLREEDLVEDYFKTVKSGGKAGLIGVSLHHPASGLRVRCPKERSQGLNRFLARRMLVVMLEKRRARDEAAALLPPPLPPQNLTLPPPPAHWGLQ